MMTLLMTLLRFPQFIMHLRRKTTILPSTAHLILLVMVLFLNCSALMKKLMPQAKVPKQTATRLTLTVLIFQRLPQTTATQSRKLPVLMLTCLKKAMPR